MLSKPTDKHSRLFNNIWLHDVTDRLRLRRRAIAKADQIDPDDVEKYPMSIGDTTVHKGVSGLAVAAIALSSLLGGGGLVAGTLLIGDLLNRSPEPPAAVIPAEPVEPAEPQRFRIQFHTEEGVEIAPSDP